MFTQTLGDKCFSFLEAIWWSLPLLHNWDCPIQPEGLIDAFPKAGLCLEFLQMVHQLEDCNDCTYYCNTKFILYYIYIYVHACVCVRMPVCVLLYNRCFQQIYNAKLTCLFEQGCLEYTLHVLHSDQIGFYLNGNISSPSRWWNRNILGKQVQSYVCWLRPQITRS